MDDQLKADLIRVYQYWEAQDENIDDRSIIDAVTSYGSLNQQDKLANYVWERFLETNPWVAREATTGKTVRGTVTKMTDDFWVIVDMDECGKTYKFTQHPHVGVSFTNLDDEDQTTVGHLVEVPAADLETLNADGIIQVYETIAPESLKA